MNMNKLVAHVGVIAISMTLTSPAWPHSDEEDAEAIDYSHAEELAFGKASDPAMAAQTIEIEMSDMMRFTPEEITINKGDTVRFVVKNKRAAITRDGARHTRRPPRARSAHAEISRHGTLRASHGAC